MLNLQNHSLTIIVASSGRTAIFGSLGTFSASYAASDAILTMGAAI